ncbi:MAG: hypothetical protein HY741_04030 [Chloroflexi bacterium]|nr:hypothetical protein [Chloroflexota bacterium]
MSTTLVTVNTQARQGVARTITIPVFIPDLDQVRELAMSLHRAGRSFQERVWGWLVTYEPEIREEAAVVQVPDGQGGLIDQERDLWSPASFTIGENGVWFFSMLWENGANKPPVEFLETETLEDA